MAQEYLEKLSVFIEQAMPDGFEDVMLECKHFFSGAALYADERICVSLTPVGLAIKLPEATRDKLLSDKTAIQLRYFTKGPIKKSYVLFTSGVSKENKALYPYVRESIEYVLATPKPKIKKRIKTTNARYN